MSNSYYYWMRAKITLDVTEILFFMHCFCVDVHIKLCTKAGNEPLGRLKFHNHGEGLYWGLLAFTFKKLWRYYNVTDATQEGWVALRIYANQPTISINRGSMWLWIFSLPLLANVRLQLYCVLYCCTMPQQPFYCSVLQISPPIRARESVKL